MHDLIHLQRTDNHSRDLFSYLLAQAQYIQSTPSHDYVLLLGTNTLEAAQRLSVLNASLLIAITPSSLWHVLTNADFKINSEP